MTDMSSISLDQITVLIQGSFNDGTVRTIERLRVQSPVTPVVLSCWEYNRDLVSQTCPEGVTIVFSDDPGSPSIPSFKIDNIRRQIVSTRAGLAHTRTPWVVKIRSDTSIDLHQLAELTSLCTPVPAHTSALFSQKIVATSLTTLDEVRSGFYFHVCDWVYLGRTEDVAAVFSAPLPEGELLTYFQYANPAPEYCSRYRSESYLIYHLVRDKLGIDYPYSGHQDLKLANLSHQVIKANFAIVNYWNLGLRSSKHHRLYLWMRPDIHAEIACGAFLSEVGLLRAAVAVGRELISRIASAFVQQLIAYRDRVR